MITMKVPFGFKSFSFGNICVFTGKIRVRENYYVVVDKLREYSDVLQITMIDHRFTLIRFATTNVTLNRKLIMGINSMLADIMHGRINAKYGVAELQHQIDPEEELLPF